MNVPTLARENVAELEAVVATLGEQVCEQFVDLILNAPRVYFTGVGRSGLAARAIAMRLMHIGTPSFVVGEVCTPGIAPGDLLVAISATGRGSVLEQCRTARRIGASVAAFTTQADSELAALASTTLVLPIRSSVPTAQHAGSLFEQVSLVIGDAICRAVQEASGASSEDLDRRHANLS